MGGVIFWFIYPRSLVAQTSLPHSVHEAELALRTTAITPARWEGDDGWMDGRREGTAVTVQ